MRDRQTITPSTNRPPTPEELYANLPQQARLDLEERSGRRTARDTQWRNRRRSQLIQSLVEGVFLYLPLEFVFYGLTLMSTAVTVVVGLVVGSVWHRISPAPATAGLIAIGGFLAVRATCGMGFLFHAIISMVFILCVSFAIWITRSSERNGV